MSWSIEPDLQYMNIDKIWLNMIKHETGNWLKRQVNGHLEAVLPFYDKGVNFNLTAKGNT